MSQTKQAALIRIQSKAQKAFGLSPRTGRLSDLQQKLKWIAEQQHVDDFQQWLKHLADHDWSEQEQQLIIPAFTVGETYFQRDPQALAWLSHDYLPQQLRDKSHYRVWSAGCCTGEEPFSLLFQLDQIKQQQGLRCEVAITATDLNPEFLAKAEAATYGSGSFRSDDETFKATYFEQLDERQWRVKTRWRNRIAFEQLNLSHLNPPRQQARFDLILCRNVLMYFTSHEAIEIIRMFVQSLSSDGLLLLGAIDAGLATEAGFNGEWAGDNYAIRRQQPQDPAPSPQHHEPANVVRSTPSRPVRSIQRSRTVEPPKQTLVKPQLTSAEKAEVCVQQARQELDRGHTSAAQNWLYEALSLAPKQHEAHVLMAQLTLHNNDFSAALEHCQKALFLRPDTPMVLFMQGQAALALKRNALAQRLLKRCMHCLTELPQDAPLEYSEGISAGHLQRLCEQLLLAGGERAH
ncbi:CheR family methyltransferase [Pseudidiomarina homiensis]|uniref:CheR family methyltransferase n=1 Tax=Pseudidiomarina homiensis TaxID=364198 RepID=UPI00215B2852|nr:CheR family methyltransferase [Pseudidiomarina homiensis]